ncbi:MAG: hypothetical protein E7166_06820 [Firmicutes bacterium]|nr:hypothetical protein [Bacillota bacterium]
MQGKLPHVFANKVGNISNNRRYYYSALETKQKEDDITNKVINKYDLKNTVQKNDVRRKIIELFKSPNNVYKVKANIKIDGKIITKNLIGRTNSSLITLDDELIEIDKIEDITGA